MSASFLMPRTILDEPIAKIRAELNELHDVLGGMRREFDQVRAEFGDNPQCAGGKFLVLFGKNTIEVLERRIEIKEKSYRSLHNTREMLRALPDV